MKKIKSFLSIILCLTMLLSIMPMSVFAVDTTSKTTDSIEINVGETKTIECKDGNIVYVLFKPSISGVYTFYSISNSDTYGYLYDASKTQITKNDDDGEGNNFSITYDLIGGNEYYWGAKFYSSSVSGTFEIALTCDHEHINTVDDGGKVATCTEDGYTAGIYCNDCNKWLYGHEEIKASHTDMNEDKICDICGNNVPIASGTAGANIVWNLYNNGHLELLGFGHMSDYRNGSYRSGQSPWYSYRNDITTITIQEGITSIGKAAFCGCNIESIIIPDSVLTIGDYAFEFCDLLKEINFGNSVTRIGSDAFYECTALTSVVIPDSVTTIDSSFNFCENLKTVSFGKGLKSIESLAFQHCALEYLSLPASVENIDEFAFAHCYNLINISVEENNQYYSSDEYGALFNKDKTKLIKYPVGNRREHYVIPEGVVSIEREAFQGSGGISSIIIGGGANPDIDVEEFEECSVLKEIVMPNSVKSIGESAFEYCALLQNFKISNAVDNIGDYAFYGCDSLTNVTLPNSVTAIGSYAFACCDNLVNVSLPDSLTNIGVYAFSRCMSLTDINIPDSITSIPESMLYLCRNLTKIVISKSVTKIYSYAFDDCDALKDVYYTGTEEQWKKISITKRDPSTPNSFPCNEPLINATIHYNYKEEETDKEKEEYVVSKLKYGADRLSFGVDITGCVGDVIDSLVVYTSAKENIASLDIISSNPDVVEIGTIEIGVGDYITSENEHMATVPLKLKAEGTSTITITSPEGVSESVTVTVYKAPEAKKSIAVFTTEKSLSVKTGDSMWLAFGLMNEDTGLVEEDWRKMAITVSDPTIISLSDYEETKYGYSLEVIGKKEGTTNVTITDTETGLNTIIVINVHDSFVQTYSYAIDDMKVFYPNNQWEDHIATNIYNLNGIYVNNYQCIKNGNTYNIDFDVYNSRYYAGSVDIYDESGMWLGYEEINKYSDISSLWDTGEQAFYLISNTIALIPGGNDSNLLTYEQESFSKHTHISLQIPEGGYFTISNNVGTAPGTFFINAFEILFDGAYTALDLATSDSVKASALSGFKKSAAKSLADRLIEARNEGLKDEVKKKAQKVMLGTMQSEINKIAKKFSQAELKDQLTATDDICSEMANLAENILNSYNISWKHLFQSATGVGESFFTQFAGPAGVALKGCFAITKSTNKLLMATQMAASTPKPYVTVYSEIEKGYINPYGVIVNTAGNMDSEAVLQVFRVSNDDAVDVILDSNNPLEKHELYNICFVKDDQLVQPSGKVAVHIPIPEGMNSNTCKVYRQESDGSWTILDAHIEGNYLVFETDHFSLYSVIGDMDSLSIYSMPNKVVYSDGDTLDTDGLVLNLNGELISEGFICEPTVLSGVGNLKITVRYGNATTDFYVRVKALGGYTISGNAVSFGSQEENCVLCLIDKSGVIEEIEAVDGNYVFENIASGTYTLAVSKTNHVTRTYKITVANEDITQDVKIHLLGDINGDGKVNTIDVNRAYAHVRETNLLSGYELECANVAGTDETVNTVDINRIYAHVKGTKLLW